ncbi:RING-H2 finger protein ATL79-like [Oryza brachyantha]|uniref:RING-H2 finger protein ATL79-like n=1 Tax=Oryza brachyantha TaxID=4533 RepID=UPI001ADC56BB|nr:RING-H2 finger protein ATL79-like [Oryza brachyantha]
MEVVVARRGVVVLRVRPGDPRGGSGDALSDRCSRLLLLWTFAVGLAIGLLMFASHVWASVAAAALLAATCLYTCLSLNAAPVDHRPPPLLRVAATPPAAAAAQQQAANCGGGLRQEDVDAAIPAFEYRKGSSSGGAAEQCAVCISVARRGETVRRLPACGHAFHAPCIDGWLRAHATCPMCRADVKVAGGGSPV